MATMNGFLFLMLILCGTAVGMILQNMKMVEDRAEHAIMIARTHAEQVSLSDLSNADSCKYNKTVCGHYMSAFLTLPTVLNVSITNAAVDLAEMKVSYDFALASVRKIEIREQANGCLFPEIVRIDICA
jgi:hypothetical protein